MAEIGRQAHRVEEAGSLGANRSSETRRWNPGPEEVRRSVMKLVLTIVELIRQLLERQALRRMDRGTLSDEEIEAVGLALEQLEQTVHELADLFEIPAEDLSLELGPLGRLL